MQRDCLDCDFSETTDIAALGHSFGQYKTTTEPTCTENGVQTRECERCHEKETKPVDKLGHKYSKDWTTTATEHFHICERCREIEPGSSQSHSFTDDSGSKCSVCGYTKTTDTVIFRKIDNGQAYAVSYRGDITKAPYEIIIPDEHDGLPVTEIADNAFSTQYSNIESPLTKVTLGKNIKRIGMSAFWHNTNLTSVTFSENLEKIDNYAFSQCSSLGNLEFNDKLMSIEREAFYNCSGLKNIKFAGELRSIGTLAFCYCSQLNDIQFNDKLESIGEMAFYACSSLQNLEFPTSLKTVGVRAFYENTGLKTIKFKDNLESIGLGAFYNCNNLTDADLGNGNLSLGPWAFEECTSLQNLNISDNICDVGEGVLYNVTEFPFSVKDGVSYIGNSTHPYLVVYSANNDITSYTSEPETRIIMKNAFLNCSQLQTVTLKDNVRVINEFAFRYCVGLQTLTFGTGIEKIRTGCFEDCRALTQVCIPSIKDWCEIDFEVTLGENYGPEQYIYQGYVNPLFYGASLVVGGQEMTSITIPDEITKISDYAFAGYGKLQALQIGKNLSQIGRFAFRQCDGIQTIGINDQNSTYYATENCLIESASQKLVVGNNSGAIPDGVKVIGEFAFYDIPLQTSHLVIPDSVEIIEQYAFSNTNKRDYNDEAIRIEVTMGSGLKRIDFWAFANCYTSKVNIKDLAAWCAIDFDGDGANPISYGAILMVEGKQIGDTHSYTTYYPLEIPSTVTEIKPWAFVNSAVQKLIIPKETTKIASSAFARAQNLSELEVAAENPNLKLTNNKLGIVDQEASTLVVCAKTDKGADFGSDNFEKVGAYVSQAHRVTKLVLPSTVTEIGEYAFSQSNLTSVTLGDGVCRILESAFSGNGELTSITIPASVNYIGEMAFGSSLTSATFLAPEGWFATAHSFEPHLPVDFSDETTAAQELCRTSCFWEKD